MAAGSLLALLDDVASVLDDVAILTKTATTRTAGVIGDDLAVNAEQVAGFSADRELPVIWAVFKGSLLNKAILVPAALAISFVAPWAITPLLVVGGIFLCFEGFEKLIHLWHHDDADAEHRQALTNALQEPEADLMTIEQDRIRGAVRTDFVLSAEIVAICLGVVAQAPFPMQVAILSGLGVGITVGVYGLVAAIVKLDDAGVYLQGHSSTFARSAGNAILAFAPWLMHALSLGGMVAMLLVGGGIIEHGVAPLHHLTEMLVGASSAVPMASTLVPITWQLVLGIIIGGITAAGVAAASKARAAMFPGH